jgi:ATP-binding cassette subfamily B protein
MKRLSLQPGAAPRGEGEHIAILRAVLPYLWPAGRFDLKFRVVLALLCLVLAKVVTVLTPFAYKYSVDALTGAQSKGSAQATAVLLLAGPVVMVIAYGVGRIMMVVFAQLRDALFAKVGQSAVRQLAIRTFRHLHALSLRFHLDRRTGGLSRIIERGTKGIDTILRYSLFNTFPTVIEIAFVAGILWWNFGPVYALVILLTIVFYTGFTYWATEWRINLRRVLNDDHTDANTKAIDSLLKFETVK